MAKQDLGVGSIRKLLLQLAIPAAVGQVVNLLYNIIDRIYIGHMPEIGGDALTGVGLFAPILMLLTAFAMLAGSGGAPLAAIAMGKGNFLAHLANERALWYNIVGKSDSL